MLLDHTTRHPQERQRQLAEYSQCKCLSLARHDDKATPRGENKNAHLDPGLWQSGPAEVSAKLILSPHTYGNAGYGTCEPKKSDPNHHSLGVCTRRLCERILSSRVPLSSIFRLLSCVSICTFEILTVRWQSKPFVASGYPPVSVDDMVVSVPREVAPMC